MDGAFMPLFLLFVVVMVLSMRFGSKKTATSSSRTTSAKNGSNQTGSRGAAPQKSVSQDTSVSWRVDDSESYAAAGSTDTEGVSLSSTKNGRSGLEDPVLQETTFKSPAEEEKQIDFARPRNQPLNNSLFEQDKEDDLTRPIESETGGQRSFNLFELDKQDDLTRPVAEDSKKSFNLLEDDKKDDFTRPWGES